MVERTLHIMNQQTHNITRAKHHGAGFVNKVVQIWGDSVFLLSVLGFIIGRASILNTMFPFGVAFLVSAALFTSTKGTTIIGTSILTGLLTRANGYHTIQSIISIALMFTAIKLFKINGTASTLKAGVTALIINFSVAVFSTLFINHTIILYDMLIGLFNSTIVMAVVYIYNYSIPIFIERRSRHIFSNEELICLAITFSIIISGLSDIVIYKVSLKTALSIFVTAAAAYGQGAGAGAGVGTTVGLITCISSNQVPVIIGTYAFCGLISGVFKDMGKIGSILGFTIGDLVILFYLGASEMIIGFKELAAGLMLFAVFPSSVMERFLPLMESTARTFMEQQSYVERMKDIIRTKIDRIIDVFGELSKALQDNESSRLKQSGEINALINSIVDKTCPECDARSICWNRDFYRTYQNLFEMLDAVESDGKVDMENIPSDLKKRCLKLSQLIKTTNYMFELYKMNYKWRLKAKEGKRVVSEQLDGIAGVLKKLSEDIRQEVNFKQEVEQELAVALDRDGIEFKDVTVTKDDTGKFQVNIYRRACLGRRECIKDIEPVASKVLKRKMRRDRSSCMIKEGTNLCYFKLAEAVKYQISTGISRQVKDESGLSGDNYSFIELDGGRYMMALSDGMGTGPIASMESNSAITLLEKYLEAGFDSIAALKAINSTMSLKSAEDNFTTVDLAITDLYTGNVEFIKVGAASTFIKRTDGSVDTINSTTLPIGILNNVDMESKTTKLCHGDMIIMVTDGVEDAGSGIDDRWIAYALESIDSKNPQQIADDLLDKARERNGGSILDDMTVLVSKVWEVL